MGARLPIAAALVQGFCKHILYVPPPLGVVAVTVLIFMRVDYEYAQDASSGGSITMRGRCSMRNLIFQHQISVMQTKKPDQDGCGRNSSQIQHSGGTIDWRRKMRKAQPLNINLQFEALWIDSWLDLPQAKAKFATMAFDQTKSSSKSSSGASTSSCHYDKIQKFSEEGRLDEALHLLELMTHQSSVVPKDAFVCLLRGCTRKKALAEGKLLHALIVQANCDKSLFLSNLLVDMYSNCGSVVDALKVFAAMQRRNVFSFTAMISAYVNSGQYKQALTLFQQMQQAGIEPDKVICVVALKACTSIAFLEQGQQLHTLITKKGFDRDVLVQTSLVDMYAKCGCLKEARELFNNMTRRNVISWSAMIAGYAQKGLGKEALDLYEQMKREGVEPNHITLSLLLKACASISALERGKELHSLILEKGLESETTIQTTLIDMYAKCGCLKDARELFDNMTQRNVISWSAMIAGYAQKGLGREALDLYKQMKNEGVELDHIALVLLLKACASISALEQGKELHSLILEKGQQLQTLITKRGFDSDLLVQTSLIDMYAKCGSLKDAHKQFNSITQRSVVSWNALIAGYAQEGLGKEALELYKQMKSEGLQGDEVTYTCVLSACSRSGLVHEGRLVFESMFKGNGVTPNLEHYACMVDLLGRAGFLADAEDFISKMPIRPHKAIWMSLLGAAKKYVNVEIGRRAFQRAVELQPDEKAPYLMLLDIYLAAGRMDEVAQLKKEMKHKGLKKVLGCSWIEIDNRVHSIESGSSHPHSKQIYAT